jgi:hypothetical protein
MNESFQYRDRHRRTWEPNPQLVAAISIRETLIETKQIETYLLGLIIISNLVTMKPKNSGTCSNQRTASTLFFATVYKTS